MIRVALGCASGLETDDGSQGAPDWYHSGDDAGDSGDSADDGESCRVTIRSTTPTAGSVDAYYRGAIEFDLTGADPTAQIETAIPGTQSVRDEKTVIWTPSAPLEASTSYSATLHYCGGDATLDFTTSRLGEPLAADVTGRAYAIPLAEARVVEPAGLGSLLGQYLTVDILAGVSAADTAHIEMVGASGKEDANPPTQDFCNASFSFPVGDFSASPFFVAAGGGDVVVSISGVAVAISNPELSGTFAADGSYFGGGTLEGTIDTRAFDSLTGEDAEEGAACELAPSFGVTCEECPWAPEEIFCLRLVADSILAAEIPSFTVLEISGYECTSVDDPDGTEGANACASWTPETLPPEPERVCREEPSAAAGCAAAGALDLAATALSLFALRRRRTPSSEYP